MSDPTIIVITVVVLLLALFLSGVELAFAMAIMGVVGWTLLNSFEVAIDVLTNDFFESLASYSLTVVPLFVLMGQVAFNAGIAKSLFDCAHKFLGHIAGGLAIATVAGATIFKAICGSAVATSATFASVAVPEMDRFKYSRKLSTGIVAIAGTLGNFIPPSVILIIFGISTQLSIGKLFMAGLIPGLILAFCFGVVAHGWCRIDPAIGPKVPKFSWKERMATVPVNLLPVLIFIVIIGGLTAGVFSPTEAGSIGAFGVLALCVIKGNLNFNGFVKSIQEAMGTAGMFLLLVASSAVLGHFFAASTISAILSEWVASLPVHRSVIMGLIMFIYLLGGSFVDDLAFMLLATPIFFPIVLKLGYDPYWAGIMIAGFTIAIGSVVPPVAICVFVVKNVTKEPMGVIYRGCFPFMIPLFFCILLLFIFPELATWLPTVLAK